MLASYKFTSETSTMDVAAIHAALTRSYWCEGIPRAVVEKAIRHSLCFGVFYDGHQIAFARVVSDHATYAYLCDVYVLEDHRGRGLAKKLMAEIKAHPELQGLRRWSLATRDAHRLYEQFGFKPLAAPDRFMEILNSQVYLS